MESEMKNAAMAAQAEQEKAVEVAPGMTVEEMTSLFFDASALREPPYKIYQLNGNGHRYYYRYDEQGEPHFYPSVTTLLKQTMPTSPFLIEWMIKNGTDGSVEKRDLAAAYGTFMHAQFESVVVNRHYDFDKVPEILLKYMEQNNLPDKFYGDSLMKIRKDICAFAQFIKDYDVRPLAIEIALVHPEYHYAGMLDMPCIMTDPKSGSDFAAIVDFKSGRKGFYEEHELQLHLYKDMWNVNYPDLPISRVFNFSPKDWRGVKPTYNLKEQTDSPNAAKIPSLLALAAIEDSKLDNTLTVIAGEMDLDDFDPKNCITSLSLSELIKTKVAKGDAPKLSGFVPKQAESVPKQAESVPKCNGFGINGSEVVPDMAEGSNKPKKGQNKAENERKAPKPINSTPKQQKPVKTDFS